jgi:hypothetical protein
MASSLRRNPFIGIPMWNFYLSKDEHFAGKTINLFKV